MILSIAIAQTQTEQDNSPSITALTIQWACQNKAISETSADGSGKADCATSAGFISDILSIFQQPAQQCIGYRSYSRAKTRAINAGAGSRDVSHGRPVQSRGWLPLSTCQNEGFPRVFSPLTRRQPWLTSGYQRGFRLGEIAAAQGVKTARGRPFWR